MLLVIDFPKKNEILPGSVKPLAIQSSLIREVTREIGMSILQPLRCNIWLNSSLAHEMVGHERIHLSSAVG